MSKYLRSALLSHAGAENGGFLSGYVLVFDSGVLLGTAVGKVPFTLAIECSLHFAFLPK